MIGRETRAEGERVGSDAEGERDAAGEREVLAETEWVFEPAAEALAQGLPG